MFKRLKKDVQDHFQWWAFLVLCIIGVSVNTYMWIW